MANKKISQLTDGNPAQNTDSLPIARSGSNFRVTAASIAALGGSANFNISGKGFFIASGMLDIANMFGAAAGNYPITNYSGNTVVAIQFSLMANWTLSSVSYQFTSVGSVGEFVNFGIYDSTGAKIIDAQLDASVGTVQTISFSPTTLPAGTYYFAYCDSGTDVRGPAVQPGNIVQYSLQILNAARVAVGVAANPASAGVLPLTLGALTASTFLTWESIPICVWNV